MNYILEADVVQTVERFIVDVQMKLQELMRLKGHTNDTLAEAMAVSVEQANIWFGNKPNMTLEELAHMMFVLDESPKLTSQTLSMLFDNDLKLSEKEKREKNFKKALENYDKSKHGHPLYMDGPPVGTETI